MNEEYGLLRDEIKKRILEISRILTERGITEKMIEKQWRDWKRYCEINKIDVFTGKEIINE